MFLTINQSTASRRWSQLSQAVRKTLQHNRRLDRIISAAPLLYLQEQDAGFHPAHVVMWPAEGVDRTVARIVKGLYFHHFDERLGEPLVVESYLFRRLPDGFGEILRRAGHGRVAGDAFVYAFGRAREDRSHSLWLLEFYQSLIIMALTRPGPNVGGSDVERSIAASSEHPTVLRKDAARAWPERRLDRRKTRRDDRELSESRGSSEPRRDSRCPSGRSHP